MRDSLNFGTLFIAIQSRFSPMSKLILHFSLLLIIFSYHRSEAFRSITRATTASLHRLRDASLKLSALSSCSETIENEPLPPRLQSPVLTFESIEQFLDTIDRAAPNQLTVVLYYAHYCKVCHKANIPYKKLAYKNSDIRFTRLETSPMTVEQFKMLGISKVPFVHIYRNGICVAAFSTKWQLEARLAEVLQLCQQRSLGEWRSFMSQLDLEIQKNKQARIALRAQLNHEEEVPSDHHICTLSSGSQLVRTINDQKKPTVVLYHSHFEEACKRAQHQYRRLAEGPHGKDFFLARIETSVLSDSTLQELGITTYPFVQVFKDGKCVASFSIPLSYMFNRLMGDSLKLIKQRSREQWEEFYTEYNYEIQSIQQVIARLRSS